jgi:DNA-binding NarL/FixJ family response regulator
VEATEATAASIVTAAVEGAPLLVVLPDGGLSARLVDALRRAAVVDDWRDEPAAALRPEELMLLHALGTGLTTAGAARRANVSLRTAFRLLSEARHTLGVASNVEAGEAVVALGLRLPVSTDPHSQPLEA